MKNDSNRLMYMQKKSSTTRIDRIHDFSLLKNKKQTVIIGVEI